MLNLSNEMDNIMQQLNIVHINIEELFGIYTYSIPNNETDISKLLILYGDNGAGKTTILQMIFNLLSSENNKGHKTELANTKFKRISIILSNGYTVSAFRKDTLIGEYYLSLIKDNITEIEVLCKTVLEDDEYIVKARGENSEEVDTFLVKIKEMNLFMHYLSDDRKIKSNINMILNEENDELSLSRFPREMLRNMQKKGGEAVFALSDILLTDAIERAVSWFRNQTLVANSIGQDSINSIYITLVEKLLGDTDDSFKLNTTKSNKEEILDTLYRLQERNKKFIQYRLTNDFNLDKFIHVINKTPNEKLELVENTLKPYMEGIEKKLNAIEETRSIIDIFITSLNNFYTGKKLEFTIENGLKIISIYKPDEFLKPTMLSSGEKQLLLLFCNTITARGQASIFIIDEPELSLNVKWQRKLINALLSFADKSSIQFVLASHSIELLTQFDDNVCSLTNIKDL